MMQPMTVLARYEAARHEGALDYDVYQERAVKALDDVFLRLTQTDQDATSLWTRLFKSKPTLSRKGVYLYGPVGRGKSMLMQLFMDAVVDYNQKGWGQTHRIIRRHFHEFMLDLHKQLYAQKDMTPSRMQNRLAELADHLADQYDILCFDEFHVTDVADAMLLMPYFSRLWERGITVIATSNVAPPDLYKNGLQRQRFLPFIEALQNHMVCLSVSGEQDYRQLQWKKSAQKHDRWITPLTGDSKINFEELFLELIGYDHVQARDLTVTGQNRVFHVPRANDYVAWLSMDDVLGHAVGAADFLILCQTYQVLLLDDVRPFKNSENNRAKRFMLLIDTMYEAGTQIYVRADCAPQDLYPKDGMLAFEFERTISRLQEMRYRDQDIKKT
jgi:cell division protein ZapE